MRARDLQVLDIACSRILGREPIDRTVPVACPCDICRAKTARKHRKRHKRPSAGTHSGTLRQRRLARLYALGFR